MEVRYDTDTWSNSIKSEQFVTIGEHEYPYIKVGSLYWIAENFKENVGNGVWYNNDSSNEQKKFGRLYPTSGYSQITNILPEGWRIAQRADWSNLLSQYTRTELSSSWWNNGEQPNIIGFNATGCGGYYDNFVWLGDRCIFGFGDFNYLNQNFVISGQVIAGWEGNDSSTYTRQKFTIRIVKDAT